METLSDASMAMSRMSKGIHIAIIKQKRRLVCNIICHKCKAGLDDDEFRIRGTTAVVIVQTEASVNILNQGDLRSLIAGIK